MRDDLKGQNLTFTEIAKLVGENWQGLTQTEKEPYERQAQAAKEKYTQDMAAYKQMPDYKKYMQYLQDFKAKHATHGSSHSTEHHLFTFDLITLSEDSSTVLLISSLFPQIKTVSREHDCHSQGLPKWSTVYRRMTAAQ
jgi:hypothetical protein